MSTTPSPRLSSYSIPSKEHSKSLLSQTTLDWLTTNNETEHGIRIAYSPDQENAFVQDYINTFSSPSAARTLFKEIHAHSHQVFELASIFSKVRDWTHLTKAPGAGKRNVFVKYIDGNFRGNEKNLHKFCKTMQSNFDLQLKQFEEFDNEKFREYTFMSAFNGTGAGKTRFLTECAAKFIQIKKDNCMNVVVNASFENGSGLENWEMDLMRNADSVYFEAAYARRLVASLCGMSITDLHRQYRTIAEYQTLTVSSALDAFRTHCATSDSGRDMWLLVLCDEYQSLYELNTDKRCYKAPLYALRQYVVNFNTYQHTGSRLMLSSLIAGTIQIDYKKFNPTYSKDIQFHVPQFTFSRIREALDSVEDGAFPRRLDVLDEKIHRILYLNGVVPRTLSNMVRHCIDELNKNPRLLSVIKSKEYTMEWPREQVISTVTTYLNDALCQSQSFQFTEDDKSLWATALQVILSGYSFNDLSEEQRGKMKILANQGWVLTDSTLRFYMANHNFIRLFSFFKEKGARELESDRITWSGLEYLFSLSLLNRFQISWEKKTEMRQPLTLQSVLSLPQGHPASKLHVNVKKTNLVTQSTHVLSKSSNRTTTHKEHTELYKEESESSKKRKKTEIETKGTKKQRLEKYKFKYSWPSRDQWLDENGNSENIDDVRIPEAIILTHRGCPLMDFIVHDKIQNGEGNLTEFTLWGQVKKRCGSSSLNLKELRTEWEKFLRVNQLDAKKNFYLLVTSGTLKEDPLWENLILLDRVKLRRILCWNVYNRFLALSPEEQLLYRLNERGCQGAKLTKAMMHEFLKDQTENLNRLNKEELMDHCFA
eukprot:CAMPEP_0117439716 /NCGR_PEP_ID=MMETSP0759-20121206/2707_1 /TAXON_ID=63605 /ORGANISM="Percolomonas cosmopolitus, Strain WS" /LENGTH=822 /DNA_ID=CAMNT_0005231437 /DNA_START=159 /DNA_END=2623 /DNA_ORIENTATION=+